jgi:hypothetical protein
LIFTWTAIALVVAYQRSFWCDELIRLGQYKEGLVGGLRSLFREPSPFSPGELVLNWVSGTLFGWLLPEEVWARLPGIAWGAGTLALAASLRIPFLGLLACGSVALLMLSAEMRPYGSLIFGGAAGFALLWAKGKPSRGLNWAAWLALAGAHIYGVCFVAFAAMLRRQWGKAVAGAVFVVVVLAQYKLGLGNPQAFSWIDLLKQTLGTLGNPHKATYVLFPLAAAGYAALWRGDRRLALETAAYLVVTVLFPIAATVRSGYFFVPRQVAGGVVPYLACVALGLRLALKIAPKPLVQFVWVAVAAVPWILSVVLKIPPFPNQPIHRLRETAAGLAGAQPGAYTNILMLDPCNQPSLEYYLKRFMDAAPLPSERVTRADHELTRTCWRSDARHPRGFCLYSLHDSRFCSVGADEFAPGAKSAALFATDVPERFDAVVHSFPSLEVKGVRALRTW